MKFQNNHDVISKSTACLVTAPPEENHVKMATSDKDAAHRNVIKFCFDLGMTPVETQKKLQFTEDHWHVSRSLVERHVVASREFLLKNQRDPTFLDRIITVDETWLHYYDPEDKRQSCVLKAAQSPPFKKAKVTKSMGKNMFIVFLDRKGVILCHSVPHRNSQLCLLFKGKTFCIYPL